MIQIGSAPGKSSSLDSPIEHIAACHGRIEERLQMLERAGANLLTQRDEALATIRSAFHFFDTSGVHHTADEEESFFPRLAAGLTEEESYFLEALHVEHERVEALYGELTACVADLAQRPAEADQRRFVEQTAAFAALYREHIRKENAHFPGIAGRLLSAQELQAISAEMKQRRGL